MINIILKCASWVLMLTITISFIKSVFQNSLFFLKNKLELQIMHKLGVSSYNGINIAYTFIWPVIYDAFFVLTIPLKIALNIEIFSS